MPDVCPIGTEIQSLVFKEKTAPLARQWAIRHGFRASKVKEYRSPQGVSVRIRQHPPGRYEAGSFRTIPLGDSGVEAVIGCPKKAGEGHMARRKKRSKSRSGKKSSKRRTTRRRRSRKSSGQSISLETKHKLDRLLGRGRG